MKRIITYLLCGAFLFSVTPNVRAVEKKEKKPVKKQIVVKKKTATTKSIKIVPKGKKKATILKGKKYDNFIDKNKNGIDDRRERLKKKPAAKASKKKEEKK